MQSCAGEESAACSADFLDIADILVDVGVHGHRNLGMPGNALQGFDVYAPSSLQLGQEGVAKHMRGHALGKADFLADTLPCVSEGTFAQCFLAVHHILGEILACWQVISQNLFQLRQQGYFPESCLGFGQLLYRPVVDERDLPANMNELMLKVDVFPAKSQHFAAANAGVEQDGQQQQILSFQQMQVCFECCRFFLGNRQTLRFLFAYGQTNALGRILRQQIILNGGIKDAVQKRSPVATSRIGIFRPLIVKGAFD